METEQTTEHSPEELRAQSRRKEIITLVYCGILLISVPILTTIMASDLGGFMGRLIYLLTSIALFALLAGLLKRRHFLWVCAPLLAFELYDFVHLASYGCTSTLQWTYTGIVAEPVELLEGLSTYYPLAIVVVCLWALYFLLTYRYAKKAHFVSKRIRYIIAGVSGGWMTFSLSWAFFARRLGYTSVFMAAACVTPINELYNVGRIAHIRMDLRKAHKSFVDYRFDATNTAQDDELVVLVLGESSRYRSWQINGYDRETSPRLAARGEQIVTYDSVYSVANLTTISVPLILSRATPDSMRLYFQEPSVVRAFQESGYQTAWIADQSFNNPFLMGVSGQTDFLYYLTDSKIQFDDLTLLKPFRDYLGMGNQQNEYHNGTHQGTGRQLAILHAMGCHFKYSSRYPADVSYFKPDLYDVSGADLFSLLDKTGLTIDKNQPASSLANVARIVLTNSYDNNLRYVDLFLDSVITTIEQTGRPAILLYIGDHGENILDTDEHKILHGQESSSIYEYHVPLFLWASDAYKQRYPERWQTIQDNRQAKITSMYIYHSMLDLGSVNIRQYDPHMSIAGHENGVKTLQPEQVIYRIDGNLRAVPLDITEP